MKKNLTFVISGLVDPLTSLGTQTFEDVLGGLSETRPNIIFACPHFAMAFLCDRLQALRHLKLPTLTGILYFMVGLYRVFIFYPLSSLQYTNNVH